MARRAPAPSCRTTPVAGSTISTRLALVTANTSPVAGRTSIPVTRSPAAARHERARHDRAGRRRVELDQLLRDGRRDAQRHLSRERRGHEHDAATTASRTPNAFRNTLASQYESDLILQRARALSSLRGALGGGSSPNASSGTIIPSATARAAAAARVGTSSFASTALDVGADGAGRDPQPRADLGVRPARRQHRQHLELAAGELDSRSSRAARTRRRRTRRAPPTGTA